MIQPKTRRSTWQYGLPLAVVASLLVSCVVVSGKKYFWFDEMLSYYMLSDPSFRHMMQAFHDQINNTPILYFQTGWIWNHLFGSSELSLRLFSSVGVCIAFVTVWFTLRRSYPFWIASLATAAVFCSSSIILSQNAEARMYGLFLAVCAGAFAVYNRMYESRRIPLLWLVLNYLIHMAVLHTHLYGIFYSGAILGCFIAADRMYKFFRPALYGSVAASWLSLLFYMPAFLAQAEVGKPRAWLPVPEFSDLVTVMDFSQSYFVGAAVMAGLFVLALILFITALALNPSRPVLAYQLPTRVTEAPDFIFGCAFLVVPVLTWLISRTVKPIFWDRYLIPTSIGWCIVLAFILSRTLPSLLPGQGRSKAPALPVLIKNILLSLFLAFLLAQPLLYARHIQPKALPGSKDDAYGYSSLPVMMLNAQSFLERNYYAPAKDRYYYILDWQAAVSEKSGAWGPQEYKHMAALKRNYPASFQHVLTTQEFLQRHNRFLVIGYSDTTSCPLPPHGLSAVRNWKGMHCPQWVHMRLSRGYSISLLSRDDWFAVWLAERRP